MKKIRNKVTGEIREVSEKELTQYGLGGSVDTKKKTKLKKAQNGGDTTLTKEQAKYAANQLRGWYNEDRLPSKFVKGRTEYDNPIYQELQEGDKRWVKGLINDPMQLSSLQFLQQQLAPGSGTYPTIPYVKPRVFSGQSVAMPEFSYGGKLKKAQFGIEAPDGMGVPTFFPGDEGYEEQMNQMNYNWNMLNPFEKPDMSVDNISYSTAQRTNPLMYEPLRKQKISIPEIKQAPNFKQTIETPQVNSYDFYNPETGQTYQKPKQNPQKPTDFPEVYGSGRWGEVATRAATGTNKFMQGDIAGGISQVAGIEFEVGKAIGESVAQNRTLGRLQRKEADNLKATQSQAFSNKYRDDQYGQMKNPMMMEHGGNFSSKFKGKTHSEGGIPVQTGMPMLNANDMKTSRNQAQIEVEHDEYYDPATNFVISDSKNVGFTLPEIGIDTKDKKKYSPSKAVDVISKAEYGFTPDQLNKKLNKRVEFKEKNAFAFKDKTSEDTSKVVETLSKPLEQGMADITKYVTHFQELTKAAKGMQNDLKTGKYGSKLIKAQNGFTPPGSKQFSTVQNPYFDPADVTEFKELLYYGDKNSPRAEQIKQGLAKGFNANPYVGNTQGAMKSLLNLGIDPTNKSAKEIQEALFEMDYKNNNNEVLRDVYNTYYNTNQGDRIFGNKEWEELTTEQRKQFFEDDIYGVRTAYMQKRLQPKTSLSYTPTKKPTPVSDTPSKVTMEEMEEAKKRNSLFPNPMYFASNNAYIRQDEPLWQKTPNLIDYRRPDIEPQLNELGKTASLLGRKGTYSQKADLFGKLTNAQNQAFGNLYNVEQQGKMNVDQYNAGALDRLQTDNTALSQNWWERISRSKGAMGTQQLLDRQAANQDFGNMLHEQRTLDYLNSIYDPSTIPLNLTANPNLVKKSYGGKIKVKKKKK